MKKIILILFLSAPTSFLFCQDLKVIYSISDLVSVNEIHTFIYKEYSISKFKSAFPKNGDNQQIEHINNRLKTDSIYNIKLYKEKIILHPVESPWDENILVVKDSLNNISWNYSNESQNSSLKILNKNVNKAYCMFRGREYEVFYTPEIPISEGPFKVASQFYHSQFC